MASSRSRSGVCASRPRRVGFVVRCGLTFAILARPTGTGRPAQAGARYRRPDGALDCAIRSEYHAARTDSVSVSGAGRGVAGPGWRRGRLERRLTSLSAASSGRAARLCVAGRRRALQTTSALRLRRCRVRANFVFARRVVVVGGGGRPAGLRGVARPSADE
jgi:hypothetical protein